MCFVKGHNLAQDINHNSNDKNDGDCGEKGSVMTSRIIHYALQLIESLRTRAGPSLSVFVLHLVQTSSRTREWGLMSICLGVIISPTSSWPDSKIQIHTNAAVIQAVSVCFLWVRLQIPFWCVCHCWREWSCSSQSSPFHQSTPSSRTEQSVMLIIHP